jgi:hypothetical protein
METTASAVEAAPAMGSTATKTAAAGSSEAASPGHHHMTGVKRA